MFLSFKKLLAYPVDGVSSLSVIGNYFFSPDAIIVALEAAVESFSSPYLVAAVVSSVIYFLYDKRNNDCVDSHYAENSMCSIHSFI